MNYFRCVRSSRPPSFDIGQTERRTDSGHFSPTAPSAPEEDSGHDVATRARGPESGRSDPPARAQPSLRSWASFKGAWSPRSSRRRPPAIEDDHSKAPHRDVSQRRPVLQRSLSVARTPPGSPPPIARRALGGSLRAAPWKSRRPEGGAVVLVLRCPTCGAETEAPAPPGTRRGGLSPQAAAAAVAATIATLPPNAVLLRRLHGRRAPPKCDLCSLDASSRCPECSMALCALCADAHGRQSGTAEHALQALPGATEGRAPPCPHHPGNALRLYCSACSRLACRACTCAAAHRCEPVALAARAWATPAIRTALDKARPLAHRAHTAAEGLRNAERQLQARASEVEAEVDCFVDSWVQALEDHREALKAEARRARDAKLEALRGRRAAVERQGEPPAAAVRFAEELLAEASDAEVLTVATALLRRLEWCRVRAEAHRGPLGAGDEAAGAAAAGGPVSLQFLPSELSTSIRGHQLYGVVTAQAVCPATCRLCPEGLSNCRQHRKTEVVVVTRDADDQPIGHGGEQVTADLRYRDASHRQLPVHVSDQKDGSYILTFIPDAAGILSLTVTVQGKHIQGSPFMVHARTIRAHTGIFHCCTFCSSHGNKEATCACGGKMPGGYKGCGHGHTGHPGRRHWSCCGNVLEGSECGRSNGVFTYTI